METSLLKVLSFIASSSIHCRALFVCIALVDNTKYEQLHDIDRRPAVMLVAISREMSAIDTQLLFI